MASNESQSDDLGLKPSEKTQPKNDEATEQASKRQAAEYAEAVLENEPRQGRFAQLMKRLSMPAERSREAKSGERTRGLVILAGTTIACLFLFFGLFTTDSRTTHSERKTTPSLGRPETANGRPDAPNRSLVPQLSANPQASDESGELTEGDVLGTMRNRGATGPAGKSMSPPPALPKRTPNASYALNPANYDPVEPYRGQSLMPPSGNPGIVNREQDRQTPRQAAATVNLSDSLRKSSIVFVHSGATSGPTMASASVLEGKTNGLLPQGTTLIARLQHSVSSAAKVPVTAVVEYNYEEDGQLIVPAGTKAYGELTQATPQGWVTLKFHTLESPHGDHERINGSAISMERTALRGDVNGKNGAKKFLTRALTGVGTIAAFAIGGRGLTAGIDNSVLLRERLASNIALAGEQQLAMLAYQQNIVVTVPANTRFYLVLHEAGVSRPAGTALRQAGQQSAAATSEPVSAHSALSDQELREMMQLRNELREMNRLMQSTSPRPDPLSPDNR